MIHAIKSCRYPLAPLENSWPMSLKLKDYRHFTGFSLTIFSTLLAVHNLYPSLRSYTTPFFQLSYYQPETGRYVLGWNDVYFVVSAIITFTAVRAICIDWTFRPLAKYLGLKKKASLRFAEQAWMAVYYCIFWSVGVVG